LLWLLFNGKLTTRGPSAKKMKFFIKERGTYRRGVGQVKGVVCPGGGEILVSKNEWEKDGGELQKLRGSFSGKGGLGGSCPHRMKNPEKTPKLGSRGPKKKREEERATWPWGQCQSVWKKKSPTKSQTKGKSPRQNLVNEKAIPDITGHIFNKGGVQVNLLGKLGDGFKGGGRGGRSTQSNEMFLTGILGVYSTKCNPKKGPRNSKPQTAKKKRV